jgi:hypothetical protein
LRRADGRVRPVIALANKADIPIRCGVSTLKQT